MGRLHQKTISTVVLVGICLLCASSWAQVIPAQRSFGEAWQNAGCEGEIPAPAPIVRVTDFGAAGDGVSDDQPAVLAAIAALGGAPGVVYFPAGMYYMAANVHVPAQTVLRGERSSTTTLRFETLGHCINIAGKTAGSYQNIVSGYTIGSSRIVVTDGSSLQAGDYAEVHQDNDPAWNPSKWLSFGQMVRIASVAGNTLTLETPLRITYHANLNPRIRKIAPIINSGVENLKVERLFTGTNAARNNLMTIRLYYAVNCWVRGVESYNGFGGHIGLIYSSRSEVTGCYIHEAHEYEGGGSGYGTKLQSKTGESLIENNIFRKLRHAMLMQASANGNVTGYNYSRENHWDNRPAPADLTSDITLHGNYVYANLFEGNICQHIGIDDSHGYNGPLNTFFRNRAEKRGINVNAGQTAGQNYVGNEAFRNPPTFFITWPGDGYSLQGSDNFEYGNHTQSDGLQAPGTGNLRDYSYYLNSDPTTAPPTPDFWDIDNAIPTIGPPHKLNRVKMNPAYARYFGGGNMTVAPPSLARQPLDLTVNAGKPATFSVEAYGTPVASYAWRKDGTPIPGATSATLVITSAQDADTGSYDVIVSDINGSVTSAAALLTIEPPASG